MARLHLGSTRAQPVVGTSRLDSRDRVRPTCRAARHHHPSPADVRLVHERYLQLLHQPDTRVRREVACSDPIAAPSADGSWPDLDYDSDAVNDWPPAHHLGRAVVLARNPASQSAALAALRFWLRHDFICPNWWFNQLGCPRQLAAMGLLLDEQLDVDVREQMSARIARAVWSNMTGQNLIWAADATVARGLLTLEAAVGADGVAHAWQPIRVSTDEGVQPDASFHQHGPQLYNGGYGHDFAVDASRLLWLARDTGFAAGGARRDLLASYLLDGLRPVVHVGRYDYTVLGRTVV